MNTEDVVEIEVFYDLVCPFCLIGKTQLDAALATLGREVRVRWSPYLLDPQLPEGGLPFQRYHRMKYGERARPMQQQVERIGQRLGIPFDFLKLSRYPQTLDGHRAVRLAAEHGQAGAMVEVLLRAYFLEDQDIGQPEVLAALAESRLGLPGQAFAQRLASDWQRDEVRADQRRSVQLGVRSVPSYRLGGRYVEHTDDLVNILSGALPAPAH